MSPEEFLRAVWPSEGYYCLATPFTIPGTNKTVFAHKVVETIEEAVAVVEREKDRKDMYFCVHSLKEPSVWNPLKVDRKTGELGAKEVRTQKNAHSARSFFFDLDVATDQPLKYSDQRSALVDLKRFCEAANMPRPLVTSSGGGLHVYWTLTDDIPSEEWRVHAGKLRQLARHYGLRADPSRTTDTASVLRVVGTWNFKRTSGKRPVSVVVDGKTQPTGEFLKRLNDAVIAAGIEVKAPPVYASIDDELGDNLTYSSPPPPLAALLKACKQAQRFAQLRGNIPEPEWWVSLNLFRFVENGREWCHKLSEKHPEYDYDATEAKIDRIEAVRIDGKALGPSTCARLADACGERYCEGCSFAKRTSPIVAARYKDEAAAPVITETVDEVEVETTIPNPPFPYKRLASGGVYMDDTGGDKSGMLLIYDHDLFPVKRVVNSQLEIEQHMWQVRLPHGETKDFSVPADALYDMRKFCYVLSHQGVLFEPKRIKELQSYMVSYIKQLQREAEAEKQVNHLGWTDGHSAFILPDKILYANGTVRASSLSANAQRASEGMQKRGTLKRQIELMEFYNHPAYIHAQFFILCSLAAPIFYPTGHHGVIVHAEGETGASKSTALYTASSMWGLPETYTINGTSRGATANARHEKMFALANLPIAVDEITRMPLDQAKDLALGISQPGYRDRLDRNGVLRKMPDVEKSTIMLTSGNKSLHHLLCQDSTDGMASSMRVFEISFPRLHIYSKTQADDYLYDLSRNCGHIGEEFMKHYVRDEEGNSALVRKIAKEFEDAAGVTAAERFQGGVSGAALAAGEFAQKLGLVPFDLRAIRNWLMKVQFATSRETMVESYSATPQSILSDYLEAINGDMLVVEQVQQGVSKGGLFTVREPRGPLRARYEQDTGLLFVLRKDFVDYCNRGGYDSYKMIKELSVNPDGSQGPICNPKAGKILGQGTKFAKGYSVCFVVNICHPDMGGVRLGDDPIQPTPSGGPGLTLH